jgi:hypothetical protein
MSRHDCCLVVMGGPRFGETISINDGKTEVGSDTGADIQFITNLLTEHHFSLIRHGKDVLLRRGGGVTLVNNASVEQVQLKDGDMIFAGGILLRYVEEGSLVHFYVGDLFYGRDRRQFPRFSTISTALAYLPEKDAQLDIVSVRTVSRGGIGLFSKQNVPTTWKIQVILYVKNSKDSVSAESVLGNVVSTSPWKDSLFLVNVRFQQPISEQQQPNLYQHLMEMEKLL